MNLFFVFFLIVGCSSVRIDPLVDTVGWYRIEATSPEIFSHFGYAVATDGEESVAISHPEKTPSGSVSLFTVTDVTNSDAIPITFVRELLYPISSTAASYSNRFAESIAFPRKDFLHCGCPAVASADDQNIPGFVASFEDPFTRAEKDPVNIMTGFGSEADFGSALAASESSFVATSTGATVEGASNAGMGGLFESVSGISSYMLVTQLSSTEDKQCGRAAAISQDGFTVAIGCKDGVVLVKSIYADYGEWDDTEIDTILLPADTSLGSPIRVDVDALAIDVGGDFLFIGAGSSDNGAGGVFIYARSAFSDGWDLYQSITGDLFAPDWPKPSNGAKFGSTLSFHSRRIAIGAPHHASFASELSSAVGEGGVWIFQLEESGYFALTRFLDGATASPLAFPGAGDGVLFGKAIALSSSFIVIGAPGYDTADTTQPATNLPDTGAAFYIDLKADENVTSLSLFSSSSEAPLSSQVTTDDSFLSSSSISSTAVPSNLRIEEAGGNDLTLLVVGGSVGALCFVVLFFVILGAVVFFKKRQRKQDASENHRHRAPSRRTGPSRSRSGSSRSRSATTTGNQQYSTSSSTALRRQPSRSKFASEYEVVELGTAPKSTGYEMGALGVSTTHNYHAAPIERKQNQFSGTQRGNDYAVFCSICTRSFPTKEDLNFHTAKRHNK